MVSRRIALGMVGDGRRSNPNREVPGSGILKAALVLATTLSSGQVARAASPWFSGYLDPADDYSLYAFTDWDTPLFGPGIQPDSSLFGVTPPSYRVDGHVIYEADGTGNCKVIEATGSYSNLLGNIYPVSVQFGGWWQSPAGPPASDTRDDWSSDFLNIVGGQVLPGDANLDGVVNFADFVVLSNHFGTSNAGWSGGDFNNDGITNFADFVILSNNFGATVSAGEVAAAGIASAVPEPASLILLGAGLLGLFGRRRKLLSRGHPAR